MLFKRTEVSADVFRDASMTFVSELQALGNRLRAGRFRPGAPRLPFLSAIFLSLAAALLFLSGGSASGPYGPGVIRRRKDPHYMSRSSAAFWLTVMQSLAVGGLSRIVLLLPRSQCAAQRCRADPEGRVQFHRPRLFRLASVECSLCAAFVELASGSAF